MPEAFIEGQESMLILPGMGFENNAFLGGFSYRVMELLDNDEFLVHVTPWGEAYENNKEKDMTLTRGQIEAILKDYPEVTYS